MEKTFEQQKQIVIQSFRSIAGDAMEIVRQFYGRLFELHPELRPMFKANIQEQHEKFFHMLAMIIGIVDDIEKLSDLLEDMGKRHVRYGVKHEHYVAAGGALLWAFEEVLKERFTPEIKAAWLAVYLKLTELATAQAA